MDTPKQAKKFSLVIPSIGRPEALHALLDSLCSQTNQNFEVVVVDQSEDGCLEAVPREYRGRLEIHWKQHQKRGASRARNFGLEFARGEIVAWPDDDCLYPPELLSRVAQEFEANPGLDGLSGILIDPAGHTHQRWYPTARDPLTILTAFYFGSATTLFLRKQILSSADLFDEDIGAGAGTNWGAGEATDLLIRLLKSGKNFIVCPDIRVIHPNPSIEPGRSDQRKKLYRYAVGMGAVLRKNRLPVMLAVSYILTYVRSFIWAFIRFRWLHMSLHLTRLEGLFVGLIRYPKE